jgi:hypothetical protein
MATVPASGGTARFIATGGGGLPVVGSEYSVRFGADTSPCAGPNSSMSVAAPVLIPPGWWLVMHLWFPSNATTGASFEVDIGTWER